MRRVVARLQREGIRTKKLEVSHAFHSPLMEPILRRFERVASKIRYSTPQMEIISNVTGRLNRDEMSTPAYWTRHIREAVRFADGIESLIEQGVNLWVEVGPKPTLLGMARRFVPDDITMRPTLRPNEEWSQLLSTLGQFYVRGVEIDWAGLHAASSRKVVLPTYPFQRQRYWVEPEKRLRQKGLVPLRPLLDKMVKSPLHQATIFETEFSTQNLPFLADHLIYDQVVVPGACHLAMVLNAAEVLFGTSSSPTGTLYAVIEDVIFPQVLVLPEGSARMVQVVLTAIDAKRYPRSAQFQVISFPAEESEQEALDTRPLIHATGQVSVQEQVEPKLISLEGLREGCPTEIPSRTLYQNLADEQILLGPAFQWIERIWGGNGEALGQLQRPAVINSLNGYLLHPALLDTFFQFAGVTLFDQETTETLLPFMVAEVRFYESISGQELWCYAQQVDQNRWDIWLIGNGGQVLAEVIGFEMRAAPRSAVYQQTWHDWLYQVTWQRQPLAGAAQATSQERGESWLIFADAEGLGTEVARQLHSEGQQCVLVVEGKEYHYTPGASIDGPQIATIDPREPKHGQWLLDEMQQARTLSGVIYARRAENGHEHQTNVSARAQNLYAGLLHLVQSLVEASKPRLWLVTENAQAVSGTELVNPVQASLWGLALTVASEYPQLRCTRIDLDNWHDHESLLAELRVADKEDQIAIRGGERFVARLARWQDDDEPEEAVQVRLSAYGTPDNLELQPLTRRLPAAHEVEIEIEAAGLNFRDVLNVLGMLADFYAEQLNIHHASDIPLGFECAGIISAVGDEVSDFEVGDKVIALAVGGLATTVTVDADQVVRLPNGLSFEEGATIPLAFLTAYQALNRLAKLQAGERVLIHAASGGVGQAAVQLAQLVGAEIFATASSRKWDFLKSMGVPHVMNSRTLDFADDVMEITNGQGVDVVLNSLSGEFIGKSLACLGQNGRFVEIGKLGILEPQQMAAQRPDVAYYPFEVGEPSDSEPRAVRAMLNELADLFDAGDLKPLNLTVFALGEVDQAVRFMQQAKHIGKVVISVKKKPACIRPESSYLITGGLGGLGLQIAQQLVASGATHLVLAGRRGVTSERAQEVMLELEAAGTEVTVVQADVSQEQDVARLLSTCETKAPLRGIIHAAGVLDDGVLSRQTLSRFEKVMAPKVQGAWHLHTQTLSQKMPLDFFVCFSSVASLISFPGQGNYAAANAFMDGLAHHRRSLGLPALSINWGAWGEIGMAADLAAQSKAQGIRMIAPEKGAELFGHLLKASETQMVVFPVDWARFIEHSYPEGVKPPFLQLIDTQDESQSSTPPISTLDNAQSVALLRLKEASASQRLDILIEYLQTTVAKVLGFTRPRADRLKAHQGLNELGVDSLTGTELKNRVMSDLKINVPLHHFLGATKIAELAETMNQLFTIATMTATTAPHQSKQEREADKDGFDDGTCEPDEDLFDDEMEEFVL